MKSKFKFLIALTVFGLLFSNASLSFADEVNDLLSFYVNKFTPERAELVISDKPDSTGMFNDIYLELTGVVIEQLRLDSLKVRMRGVQFNEPSQWASGNVECKEALSVLASGKILESDINKSIANRTFGEGDHWHDLSMKIASSGLSGRGYYKFSFLDILIEINSGLRIVQGKELWLNNPLIKINKMDLPDYVTRKALSQIQPLVNLQEFPLPLSLNRVELSQGEAVLSSRRLPEPLTDGLKYIYIK
ncbi:MAG: DUF2993 domain-containing protein [Synergistaceae bacterium]|nr:DUF2993 domain-containing protein [Synergistaceae bacterium]